MGITMTHDQKKVFDEGAKFSFELIVTYINKHWSKSCETSDEKRDFIVDIWNFVDYCKENISLYQMIDEAVKERQISEDDVFFFETGIREHNSYVKFCFVNDDHNLAYTHLRDYFAGKISAYPNQFYPNFDEWAKA